MQVAFWPGCRSTATWAWHRLCIVRREEGHRMDILFVAAAVVFFAVSLAYVRGCDRL
jgi:hypothetical protein